jgi:WD40 repeat protein
VFFPVRCLVRLCLLAAAVAGFTQTLPAQGTLIPITTEVDMVFDHAGKYLYITTSTGLVQPYNLTTGQLEPTYNVGVGIDKLDIARDDSFLLLTTGPGPPNSTIYKLDLKTGAVTDIVVANDGHGTTAVAIASNNRAFVTTEFGRPVWQINLATNEVTLRSDAPGSDFPEGNSEEPIYRSADGRRLYFLGNHYLHRTYTYDATNNAFSASFGPSQEDYTIGAVNRNGTLLGTAISPFGESSHAALDDASTINPLRSFPNAGGGVAFDAVRDVLYAFDNSTSELVAYDTNTFAQIFRTPLSDDFFQEKMVASGDGRYLAWHTLSGIRVFAVPNPLPSPTPTPTPSLANVSSIVFDHTGKYLYAGTNSGMIHRYDYTAGKIDRTYFLGGSINGIDITPDDSLLMACQNYPGTAQGVCYKIDLAAGTVGNIFFPTTAALEVAVLTNDKAFLSAAGGPWALDLSNNSAATRYPSGQVNTGLMARSADGSRVYFAAAGLAGGDFQTYDRATDTFSTPLIYSYNDRPFPNPAIAVSRQGAVIATRSGTSASIDTASEFNYVHSFGGIDGGIAFGATSDTLYAIDSTRDRIVAWDSVSFTQKFQIDVGEDIPPLTSRFGPGRLAVSPDDHAIALITPTTVRVYSVPPSATPAPTPLAFSKAARDLAFDHNGQYLYVTTSEGLVQQYNLTSGTIDHNYEVGGSLNALDIAQDDTFLFVADGTAGLTQGALHRLNLVTGAVTDIIYPLGTYELGPWDLAITARGTVLFTTDAFVYGFDPIRQIDVSSNLISVRSDASGSAPGGQVIPQTQVHRSADRTRLYFLEKGSDFPGFVYTASTDTFGPSVPYQGGGDYTTAAVNRNGTLAATRFNLDINLAALPSLTGLYQFYVFDPGFPGGTTSASGVAFDATKDVLYGVQTYTDEIAAEDSNTHAQLYRFKIGENVDPPVGNVNSRFSPGNLAASPNGQYLGLITPTTVRVYDLNKVTKILPSPTPPPVTPQVNVTTGYPKISEGLPSEIIISATPNTTRPLTINYSMGGTATFGADYTVQGGLPAVGQVAIPVGQNSVDIWLTSIADQVKEKKETVIITIQPGNGYTFGGKTGKKSKGKKQKGPTATIVIGPSI